MEKDHLNSLLTEMLGHLQLDKKDESLWENDFPILARSLLNSPLTTAKPDSFSFERSQLFAAESVPQAQMEKIRELVEKTKVREEKVPVEPEPRFKAVVRDVPIRTTQIANSTPKWAAGAKVDRTIGPITQVDGREVLIDLYRVTRLIGLYQQNSPLPVILFQATFQLRQLSGVGSSTIEVSKEYNLAKGSVWIRADMLATNAPSNRYAGLKVDGGKIQLSHNPVLQGEKLVLGAQTGVQVSLNLSAIAPKSPNSNSTYGKDTEVVQATTPASFAFSFSGASKAQVASLGNSSLRLYGQQFQFTRKNAAPLYHTQLSRLLLSLHADQNQISPVKQISPLMDLSQSASLKNAHWAIPCAELDVNEPLEAGGVGGFLLEGSSGLKMSWKGLQGRRLTLDSPLILAETGRIGITDLESVGAGAYQEFEHWRAKGKDHSTSLRVSVTKKSAIIYNSLAEGVEMLLARVNGNHQIDRPITVAGLPIEVKTKNSILALAASEDKHLIYFIDDNILWDNMLPFDKVPRFRSIALALENALFSLTPVNGAMIFGQCNEDWTKINRSQTLLVFGLLSYMPTLPDPYLANLTVLQRLFMRKSGKGLEGIISWLVCQVSQKPMDEKGDEVKVAFHFGPETNQTSSSGSDHQMMATPFSQNRTGSEFNYLAIDSSDSRMVGVMLDEKMKKLEAQTPLPDFETQANYHLGKYQAEYFSLLDVSSHANQLGISLGPALPMRRIETGKVRETGDRQAQVQPNPNQFFGVEGMQVVVQGSAARLYMLPQVAWEPVINLTPPGENVKGDPNKGMNYYPNDGGPSRLVNYHIGKVPLIPRNLVDFTLGKYYADKSAVDAVFTLPFGLRAKAELTHEKIRESTPPDLHLIQPKFPDNLQGGLQIRAIAKDYGKDATNTEGPDEPMFKGFTVQLANIITSNPANPMSTLGRSVTRIFNSEFFTNPSTPTQLKERGVPLSYIDFSGYGASTFSNWLSPRAAIAETSQARFDVMLGRTAHEVIQVKSILYPWGIRVVRTITLFRAASGKVFRTDSGWQAESDGLFDFTYKYIDKSKPTQGKDEFGNTKYYTVTETPYELHTGPIRGLFNISNIQEDGSIAEYNRAAAIQIPPNQYYVDTFGEWVPNTEGETIKYDVILSPVWFDADVELDNLVQGHKNGRTPSKKILGYVQISPQGVTIPKEDFKRLLEMQGGQIGGDIDCVMDLNRSGQLMRITRFDISPSVGANNNPDEPIFVAAARGNVLLPKDGSWSMVQHLTGSGEVTPLDPHVPIPIIREGKWSPGNKLEPQVLTNKLLRIAHPKEILRTPKADTFNFGFLQSTATQKALFLTPSFRFDVRKLLSKTPPAFADAYRLMDSNAIFPNIGDGYSNLGKAIALTSAVDTNGVPVVPFQVNGLVDAGREVFELLATVKEDGQGKIVDRGFKLLANKANNALDKAIGFDIPSLDPPLYLVNMDSLKIYIEYKAKETKKDQATPYVDSKLNFDVDSFANDLKETWKSRANNLAMVVDLGSFERLMIIKGNFDAQKGKESGYEGGQESQQSLLNGLPTPEVEFSEELQPVVDLLQLLASLSTGDYAAVMKKGLQIAMSNAGEIWEYKFEATKEIPLVRFPPEDHLYNSPQCPLRLEAGLSLGVYFNAALKVTTDAKELLPTAGAFIQFKGGLEVMCVTVGGATIYAIGSVDLKLACDTKVGPSVQMKFGFGASISVGLPVVGNVSVTYMVGCEIYASSKEIAVTAFMLFKGRASLAGGLVSVTIYIEASGTVRRIADVGPDGEGVTECTASVTFGLDISICFIIDISFEETWQESRQIA